MQGIDFLFDEAAFLRRQGLIFGHLAIGLQGVGLIALQLVNPPLRHQCHISEPLASGKLTVIIQGLLQFAVILLGQGHGVEHQGPQGIAV